MRIFNVIYFMSFLATVNVTAQTSHRVMNVNWGREDLFTAPVWHDNQFKHDFIIGNYAHWDNNQVWRRDGVEAIINDPRNGFQVYDTLAIRQLFLEQESVVDSMILRMTNEISDTVLNSLNDIQHIIYTELNKQIRDLIKEEMDRAFERMKQELVPE